MNPKEVIEAYFAAWDAHDPEAIVRLYTDDGSYEDPVTDGPLSGAAIGGHAQSLFEAFPDLRLELISQAPTSTGDIAVPWILFGTHQGDLGEMEATGKSVVLYGCDFIEVRGDKMQRVYGTFSLTKLIEQLN